jgi:Group II intron, maturase-specific domain/Reverse transcriptase (RNA-dependent DNA polymerase)
LILEPPASVQKLQTALQVKAKEKPDYRFYLLYDKVYRKDVLAYAYQRCKANNGAPGIDGQDFADVEAYGEERWLDELADTLRRKTYRPEAVRRVWIPKANGKLRPLGIPRLADRVVMVAATVVLEAIFEVDMPAEQYGYADDGLVHCRNEQEAQALKAELQARLAECHLEMHPTKTKVVYCKDGKRKGKYPNIQFDFLGYCFRPRLVRRSQDGTLFWGFNPAVSVSALKAMRATIRELDLRHRTQLSLGDIAQQINPLLRGWIEYYGRYAPSALKPMLRYVNQTLLAWAIRKFKRFTAHKVRASHFLQRLTRENAKLFVHWRLGMTGTFA